MTTLPHHPGSAAAARQASEDGQILVLTVVVALALLAILGLVADGGLVLARHRELQGVADAAARAGAAQLDEASYRASNGRTATLNPTQAQAAAGRYLRTVRFGGETSITANPSQVTIGLSEVVRPIIFSSVGIGPIRLAVHAVARPRTGIAQAQGP
jgi:Flp pilus assembly protein TadG